MPKLSMFGIIYFTLVTTAAGRDNLLAVGGLLFLASIIHNSAGYFFGYWLSRLFGMNRTDSRTIAFEVGLQNGGMASGIAGAMGKLGTVGLAAAPGQIAGKAQVVTSHARLLVRAGFVPAEQVAVLQRAAVGRDAQEGRVAPDTAAADHGRCRREVHHGALRCARAAAANKIAHAGTRAADRAKRATRGPGRMRRVESEVCRRFS
jgi:hypothetical protein